MDNNGYFGKEYRKQGKTDSSPDTLVRQFAVQGQPEPEAGFASVHLKAFPLFFFSVPLLIPLTFPPAVTP